MTALAVIAIGWVCLVVGLILTVAAWTLIPVGVLTGVAGFVVDWEAVGGKRS